MKIFEWQKKQQQQKQTAKEVQFKYTQSTVIFILKSESKMISICYLTAV